MTPADAAFTLCSAAADAGHVTTDWAATFGPGLALVAAGWVCSWASDRWTARQGRRAVAAAALDDARGYDALDAELDRYWNAITREEQT